MFTDRPLLKIFFLEEFMADKVIVEKDVAVVDGTGESTGKSAIWAITFIIVIALIAGAVYYSGILKRVPTAGTQKIDVKVSAPAAPSN